MLSHSHNETVHLVVDLRQSRAMGGAHGGWGVGRAADTRFKLRCVCRCLLVVSDRFQSALEQCANVFVIGLRRKNLVPVENAARIGIHDKDRVISRI